MKKLVLYASIAFSSGLFFTNIYNSIVNAANWESNVPNSITAAKDFFAVANPGTFFQLIDPTNLILIMLALISPAKTLDYHTAGDSFSLLYILHDFNL